MVQADHLTLGDELRTDTGASKIVNIERPVSVQPVLVYNMNLGTPQEKAGTDDTTLFAGGIVVGDNQMQGRYEELARFARPEDVPEEFRADYLAWVEAALGNQR